MNSLNANALIDTSQPFYFGGDEHLFGNYHAAPIHEDRRWAVLLCYPLGIEYIYGHRAYRQLALRANQAGFPVMRFDYYGTGDAAGDDRDASLSRWLKNISTAIEELKRRSGASSICLAGLRLGASLAVQAALTSPDVTSLILWEPIVTGKDYLAELQESHQRRLWYLPSLPVAQQNDRSTEVLGFALSDVMYHEIEQLDLSVVAQKPADDIFLIEQNPQPHLAELRAKLESLGGRVNYQEINGPAIWAEDPDKALVPYDILKAAVHWMGETLK